MKKKLLSFLLAICMFLPCSLLFSACGGNPHTHNWSTDWSYNSTEHWLTCDGCDDTKDKATHDGDVCSICGYENQTNNNLPVEQNVRDLEILTITTNGGGTATLVLLPDGKNMLIDSGADDMSAEIEVDELLIGGNIETIDYFAITSSVSFRNGAADLVFDYYDVKNFYKPVLGSGVTPSTAYETALEKANAESGCTVHTVEESTCDIDYSFKDNQGNTHNYKIDFMIPVAPENCSDILDNGVVVTIEYQGKIVMISGSATENNIDSYCTKYGTQKDVDVLITSYYSGDQEAISGSSSRAGSDYLSKISFDANDFAIIVPVGSETGVEDVERTLADICGSSHRHSLTSARGLSWGITKITSSGELSVESR